ncbi:MAG: hybrid sensor histidine kinase/response regulator, partial [Pseudomonadota bacterium]|nr:hybrid sensor histidine kinase/response regulator [Pseudomonadota bacterium]
ETTFTELGYFFDAHPNAFQQARLFNLRAYKHILEQDLVAGYETLLEARKLAKKGGNTMALAESFLLEGIILDLSGEHARALEALNKSLAAFIEVNSDNALLVYSAMGNVYMSLQNYEMMLQLGQNFLAAAQRLNDKENKAIAYFFQGYAQTELGDYQDAKISLLLAEELFKEVHYPFIGIVHTKMAELHIAQGNLTEALTMLNRAAESDRKVGFKYNEGSRLLRLVDIYIKRNQIDLAISELEGGLKKDAIKNDKSVVLSMLEKLISLLESTNNFEAALEYSKLYTKTYEESFNEQQSRLLALNRVRLSISEKEETIKLLEKDNQLK